MFKGTGWQRRQGYAVTPLGLLALAGPLMRDGHKVSILDMCVYPDNFSDAVKGFKPDIVGITSMTHSINHVRGLAGAVKKIDPGIKVAIGGVHATVMSNEVAECQDVDWVIRGEGDFIMSKLPDIKERIVHCGIIHSMDDIPIPPYELLGSSNNYHISKFISKESPMVYIETSRGCYGKCTFCAKQVQGRMMRFKTIDRVLEEIRYVLSLGYREIQIADYTMAADKRRMVEFCERVISSKLKFSWHSSTGIRVDNANLEMFKLLKRTGCYRVSFGIESGSQRILNSINKGVTLDQIRNAVKMAKQANIETAGFFMMAMPGETEEDLKATINFACELDLDVRKTPCFIVPFPGTEMTNLMKSRGQIKSYDWSKYNNFACARDLYDHDTLSWEVLERYHKLFMRRFTWRWGFLSRRFVVFVLTGKWKGFIEMALVKLQVLK